MKNIFYAPKSDFSGEVSVEIKDQEALHISKVLRQKIGDIILIADGEGNRFESEITEITKRSVSTKIISKTSQTIPGKKKIMAMGVIKKRDRLEFAIEKAVELGASELCLFNADHSERSKLNEDRIKIQMISAFKQSSRYWLPRLAVLSSLDEVYKHYPNSDFIMAHEEIDVVNQPSCLQNETSILMVGPEGGFSSREIELNKEKGGKFISLGQNRLRAETAVVAFLSQYLFST